MRSLKRVFENIKRKNPYWSDYVCFSQAVFGKCFSKKTICRHFNKLVDSDDYSRKEKKAVLEWLISISQVTKTSLRKAGFKGKRAFKQKFIKP